MLSFPPAVRIWLCTQPTDLRKSFDSLAELVRQHLAADPLSGHVFVFRNRAKSSGHRNSTFTPLLASASRAFHQSVSIAFPHLRSLQIHTGENLAFFVGVANFARELVAVQSQRKHDRVSFHFDL